MFLCYIDTIEKVNITFGHFTKCLFIHNQRFCLFMCKNQRNVLLYIHKSTTTISYIDPKLYPPCLLELATGKIQKSNITLVNFTKEFVCSQNPKILFFHKKTSILFIHKNTILDISCIHPKSYPPCLLEVLV